MTEYQLLFNLTDGGGHVAVSPRHALHQKMADASVSDGQCAARDFIREIPVSLFVRDEEIWLRGFLKCLAHGNAARNPTHQQQAIALLNVFDAVSDMELALELRKLGFCDSTKSFGCTLTEGQCVLLWKFRAVMKKYNVTIP